MNKKSKIFVAGHNGLLGTSIVKKLKYEGYNNLILRTKKELNLLIQKSVESFFEKERPEVVILCAAKVGGVKINSEFPFDMLYENIQIQNNVIATAHKYDVNKLLFIASSTIYPADCEQPIKESYLFSGPLDPLHESYGFAKIEGIKLCEKINKQFNKNFFTLVPNNIYGEGDHLEESRAHVIGALMTRFHKAKINKLQEVIVWGSGNALREFIYVDDVAAACFFFLKKTPSMSYINIGAAKEISIKELAYLIKDIIGYKGKVIFDTSKPEGRLRRKLDTTIAEYYGRNASISLEEGLRKTYDYFLSTL